MDDCICIQTSQHALLSHSGQNQPAAPNQPWPFTTSPWGRLCASWDSTCTCVCVCLHVCEHGHTHTHTYICLSVCMCVCVCGYRPPHYTASLIYLQTDSSAISSPTPPTLAFFFQPPLHSLSLWCSPPIHPSSKYRPSLNLTLPSLLLPILLPHPSLPASIYPSLHLHLLPAG